jgi:hypothetical protein
MERLWVCIGQSITIAFHDWCNTKADYRFPAYRLDRTLYALGTGPRCACAQVFARGET